MVINLLVFRLSRANVETYIRLRSVSAATQQWCENFFCCKGKPQRRLTSTTIISLRTRPVYLNHGILFTTSLFSLYGIIICRIVSIYDCVYLICERPKEPFLTRLFNSPNIFLYALIYLACSNILTVQTKCNIRYRKIGGRDLGYNKLNNIGKNKYKYLNITITNIGLNIGLYWYRN